MKKAKGSIGTRLDEISAERLVLFEEHLGRAMGSASSRAGDCRTQSPSLTLSSDDDLEIDFIAS